jgi:hypothetical protein
MDFDEILKVIVSDEEVGCVNQIYRILFCTVVRGKILIISRAFFISLNLFNQCLNNYIFASRC